MGNISSSRESIGKTIGEHSFFRWLTLTNFVVVKLEFQCYIWEYFLKMCIPSNFFAYTFYAFYKAMLEIEKFEELELGNKASKKNVET